jgi:hypothetical protein
VINEDYIGEIKIMMQAPGVFVAVAPEIKTAQLVILPNVKKGKVLTHTPWRDGGFDSSNHAYWVQQATKNRPEMTLFLNEKLFGGFWILVLISVIAARHWPKSWPCQPSAADLQGVGAAHGPLQSAQQIGWRNKDGHSGLFCSLCLEQSSSQSGEEMY